MNPASLEYFRSIDPSAPPDPASEGWALILRERERQIQECGYTNEYDMQHVRCELRRAADCLSMPPCMFNDRPPGFVPRRWPWGLTEWWSHSETARSRMLVMAGALYLAEAERQRRIDHRATSLQAYRRAVKCARLVDWKLREEERILDRDTRAAIREAGWLKARAAKAALKRAKAADKARKASSSSLKARDAVPDGDR